MYIWAIMLLPPPPVLTAADQLTPLDSHPRPQVRQLLPALENPEDQPAWLARLPALCGTSCCRCQRPRPPRALKVMPVARPGTFYTYRLARFAAWYAAAYPVAYHAAAQAAAEAAAAAPPAKPMRPVCPTCFNARLRRAKPLTPVLYLCARGHYFPQPLVPEAPASARHLLGADAAHLAHLAHRDAALATLTPVFTAARPALEREALTDLLHDHLAFGPTASGLSWCRPCLAAEAQNRRFTLDSGSQRGYAFRPPPGVPPRPA